MEPDDKHLKYPGDPGQPGRMSPGRADVSFEDVDFQGYKPHYSKRDYPSEHPGGPGGSHSADIAHQAVRGEFVYGVLGLLVGATCLLLGVALTLRGATGSASWTASFLGLESELSDAGPGVVLFVVGVFLVLITRPNVKAKNLKG